MMKQKISILSVVILLLAATVSIYNSSYVQADDREDPAILQLHQQSQAFIKVAKKVTPAVVHISVSRKVAQNQKRNRFDDFFRNNPQLRKGKKHLQRGAGSGVIIDPRGYILSNHHVINKAEEVIVTLNDKRTFKAKVIGSDAKTDVAVIKIDADNLPVAPIGDSHLLAVGEWVLAIGNPFGLSQTVTAGIISAKGRSGVGITEYEDFIQTDAAINPGNSGGPLVNLYGEVIGINTAILSRTGGYQGIGFAIPANMARKIMEQIIETGKVRRSWLGVQIEEITPDTAKVFGLDEIFGCLVQQVMNNSPAKKGGLKDGDIILFFNNVPVTSASQLRNQVAITTVGKTVSVVVFRNQHRVNLKVTLGDLSKANWGNLTQEKPTTQPQKIVEKIDTLGFEVQQLDADLAKALKVRVKKGVVITNIDDGSIAARSSLRKGDVIKEVNRVKINNIAELKNILGRSKNQKLLLFRVKSGTFRRFVVLKKD